MQPNTDAVADPRILASPPWWTWLTLVLVGLATLIPGSAQMPLIDRDEPRFSQATIEMEQRGTWVVPYFNDEYRFDKPPLTYWWMRLNYAVFGHNELGARMHSILSSIGVALVILAMGRSFFGWKTAFWAALGWLTLLQVWIHGRVAVADMPMILAFALAHWGLWRLLTDDTVRRWGLWFWVFWLSIGLGFLAKGPILLAGVALTLILFRWVFWRHALPWKRLQPLSGTVLTLAIIGSWGIPALIQTRGLFWDVGMGKHVIDRGVGAFNDRDYHVYFYLLTAFTSLFPWFARLGMAWKAIREGKDRETAFLLAWTLGPYIIFTFYATQLPHYVMPAFPAMLFLLFRKRGLEGRFARYFFTGYHALFGFLIFVLAMWLVFGPVFLPLKSGLLGMVAVLIGLQFAGLSWERSRTWGIGVGIAMVAIGSGLAGAGMQKIMLSPLVGPLAKGVDGEVVGIGYTEPSLVFYSGRPWGFYPDSEEGVREALATNPSMIVVERQEQALEPLLGLKKAKERPISTAAALTEELLAGEGYTHFRAEGLNIGRSKWTEVDIYKRVAVSEPEGEPAPAVPADRPSASGGSPVLVSQ